MMIVTGAASFLGSCMISKLNQRNFNYIITTVDAATVDADAVNDSSKNLQNLHSKKIQQQIDTARIPVWLAENHELTEFIFHLSYEPQLSVNQSPTLKSQNFSLLKNLWDQCVQFQIPFLFSFAQSERETIEKWISSQEKKPFFWAGLQLPGIYGPNEFYLKDQASIIYQTFHNNLKGTVPVSDWVYVKDVVKVAYFLVHHRQHSGIYPIETGRQYSAEEVKQLVGVISEGLASTAQEPFIPEKLQAIGYDQPLYSLASGISDYIHTYLKPGKHY